MHRRSLLPAGSAPAAAAQTRRTRTIMRVLHAVLLSLPTGVLLAQRPDALEERRRLALTATEARRIFWGAAVAPAAALTAIACAMARRRRIA